MIRLVYMSHAVKPFATEDLMQLLRECRDSNAAKGVTGVLLYFNDSFIQVLEGKEEIINKTFQLIKKDPRHKNVVELERTYILQPEFPDWSMGFEEIDPAQFANFNIEGFNHFFNTEEASKSNAFDHKLISTLMKHLRTTYKKRHSHEELPVSDEQNAVLLLFHKAIRFAVTILAALMVLVIFLGVFDVIFLLYEKLSTPPYFLMHITDIPSTFGVFLAVLIAIEIFLNISLYLRSDVIPVKLVVATALMAISRKVIVFDYKHLDPAYVYASAAVVLALGVTYWLVENKTEKINIE
ncbi:MAG: blue light sensor protein [Gammaproteobacteria bacterium HGW-Gammaproteobacteria-3]|nr:MAG: blue light sensor protein [Gammaproteobacteria bacterium HGW-Gammaproteobacteria-3]